MADDRFQDLIRRLKDPWKPTRNEAAHLLAAEGEPVIPAMRELLLAPDRDHDLAEYAVWVLEQLDTPEGAEILDQYWEQT